MKGGSLQVVPPEVKTDLPPDGRLQTGDVIRAVSGRPVRDLYDFHKTLLGYPVGQALDMEVERAGEMLKVPVTVSAIPKPAGEQLARRLLGLHLVEKPMGPEQGRTAFGKGVAISEIDGGGAGEKASLRPGLFVVRINEVQVNSLEDAGLALESVRPGDAVLLTVVYLEESGSYLIAQSSQVGLEAE